MSAMFPFEDFGAAKRAAAEKRLAAAKPAGVAPAQVASQVEEARSNGYEAGYKAGWDDAAKAEEETGAHVSAEFARNLQDLGFTFHEARSHVIKSLEPLLLEMTEKVLPELVSKTLGQSIIEELLPLAEASTDSPIEILISPHNRAAIESLVLENLPMVIEFVDEPSLTEGQVFLRLGSKERKLDLDAAIANIREAVQAAFTINKETIVNG